LFPIYKVFWHEALKYLLPACIIDQLMCTEFWRTCLQWDFTLYCEFRGLCARTNPRDDSSTIH